MRLRIKMGTYMVSTNDIVEDLAEALDKIEGDFTDKQLQDAIMVIKKYPYICDKTKSENKFHKAWDSLKN